LGFTKVLCCEAESRISLRSIRVTSNIAKKATNPRHPAECDLEWALPSKLVSRDSGTRICHGDTVLNKAPRCRPMEEWYRGGFT
jgi:hypothetical protein